MLASKSSSGNRHNALDAKIGFLSVKDGVGAAIIDALFVDPILFAIIVRTANLVLAFTATQVDALVVDSLWKTVSVSLTFCWDQADTIVATLA